MREVAAREGGMPTTLAWVGPPSLSTLRNLFGSWRAALEAAGYKANPHGATRREVCDKGHPMVDTGRSHYCRVCRRESDHRGRKAQPGAQAARRRARYATDARYRERVKAQQRARYAERTKARQ